MRPWRVPQPAVGALALVCGFAMSIPPVHAETKAALQIDAEGRGGHKRHRLSFFVVTPEGRDAMLVLSCRVDDPRIYGVALDFAAGESWGGDGEEVAVVLDAGPQRTQQMSGNGEYLVLGGQPARRLFAQVLAARRASFKVRDRFSIVLELDAVPRQVARFRELCPSP